MATPARVKPARTLFFIVSLRVGSRSVARSVLLSGRGGSGAALTMNRDPTIGADRENAVISRPPAVILLQGIDALTARKRECSRAASCIRSPPPEQDG